MIRPARTSFMAVAGALALSGCISFGPDVPDSLLTLTPLTVATPGTISTGTPESAIAVKEPTAPQRLAVDRVPVQIDNTNVAYLEGATWVERPARLFQNLLAETIRQRSGRIVVDNDDSSITPQVQLRGAIREFGYDAQTQTVMVRYDAIREINGEAIQTRRFESVVPVALPEAAPVGVALNQAANDVATQVADWIQ
ncbi:ABC transporter [Altererythrobacter sp. SALINAS58]|uniref:ABC-type transport auxiliary lipoprotein family protein n=1 Tax=Alteripontixanthobacter muriae TaxID=2705546 RepID=UPI001577148F|nr:ABC-type transport auxiliary lipoprotein family protein [Alteripontixanthobacter muriae]NTZ42276.1 ABC transporter [Alteripontixanthobacter muriae]